MVRSIGVGLVVAAVGLACSSSSSSGTAPADCFVGTYDVTFTRESGDCGETNVDTTYSYALVGTEYRANLPAGATPSGGTFDRSSCHAQYGYTMPVQPGCAAGDTISDDFQFTSTGFTGTFSVSACVSVDGGTVQNCSGVYAVKGARKS